MWQTIGQPIITDLLQRALKKGSLSHAYLLSGPPQAGKMTLALDLSMTLNCRAEKGLRPCGECSACQKIASGKHPDVQVIQLLQDADSEDVRAKAAIGVGQVDDMLHSANLPPFEGEYKVYIIDEVGLLSLQAANRLLKTLEEPQSKVLFILLTADIKAVPATVISRCQWLKLSRVALTEIETALVNRWQIEPQKARLLSRLSQGCPGWAIAAANNDALLVERQEKFERILSLIRGDYSERFAAAAQMALQFGKKRKTVYEILDTWLSWWRDLLLVKTGCDGDIINIDFCTSLTEMAGSLDLAQIKMVIENLGEASEQLKLNANARLVLENLMLNIPRPTANQNGKHQVEVKYA